jgi:hypothetical protein
MGPSVIADLDTLLIALYVELTDRIIPTLGPQDRAGPGRPARSPTPSWSVWPSPKSCCATTTNTTGCGPRQLGWGACSPGLLSQPAYDRRLRGLADLMEVALRWLAEHTPATAELLRLLDGTPVVCGRSRATAKRSDLAGWAGYGHDASHHCFYWGSRLLLLCTPGGTVTGFGLANPKLVGERQQAQLLLAARPANRPPEGAAVVTDKGLAGTQAEGCFAGLGLCLIRPARADEPDPGVFPGWLRQRIEAIIWTLKHQLGLDHPGGRVPTGLWARVVQRLLALNAAIWFNWQIGAPVKRSLIAYDH